MRLNKPDSIIRVLLIHCPSFVLLNVLKFTRLLNFKIFLLRLITEIAGPQRIFVAPTKNKSETL